MSSRDARLLSRLLESLDTLDNDAEIALAVRHARRIAPGVFAGRTDVSLAHTDQHIAVRLRALGIALTRLPIIDQVEPTTKAQAIAKTCMALIEGGKVSLDDLLVTLSLLRDLLQAQQAEPPTLPRAANLAGDLHAAMEAVNVFTRR